MLPIPPRPPSVTSEDASRCSGIYHSAGTVIPIPQNGPLVFPFVSRPLKALLALQSSLRLLREAVACHNSFTFLSELSLSVLRLFYLQRFVSFRFVP